MKDLNCEKHEVIDCSVICPVCLIEERDGLRDDKYEACQSAADAFKELLGLAERSRPQNQEYIDYYSHWLGYYQDKAGECDN